MIIIAMVQIKAGESGTYIFIVNYWILLKCMKVTGRNVYSIKLSIEIFSVNNHGD